MIQNLINNDISLSKGDKFCAILGINPSDSARSPLLWNAAYFHYGLSTLMFPLDVSEVNFENLLNELNYDQNFIGGAVTMPYKENAADWLGNRITAEAKHIGAVNCLYRGKENHIYGTNTDGEASVLSYRSNFGDMTANSILILGTGGVAKAVSAYFAAEVGETGKITMVGRSENGKEYAKSINADWINWSEVYRIIKDVDGVINCTSIGFLDQENESPLTMNQINLISSDANIFDVIYQPVVTKFLSLSKERGLNNINGSEMNIDQAVLAFNYVNPSFQDLTEIKKVMLKAAS